MSDRTLFVISILVILTSIGCIVWLIGSGQMLTLDGLFLLSSSGLAILAFALYAWFLIRRNQEALKPPPPAKPGAKKPVETE